MFHETVKAEGHLIDSKLLERIFDRIVEQGAAYEVLRFEIGKTNEDFSSIELRVEADDSARLTQLLEDLVSWGCQVDSGGDARIEVTDKDRCVPEDFCSTTNHRTEVCIDGEWMSVGKQRKES